MDSRHHRRRRLGFGPSPSPSPSMSGPNPNAASSYAYSAAAAPSVGPSYFPTPFRLHPPPPPSQLLASSYPSASSAAYALPQYHQAQQLFHRDAQAITPQALETVKAALASSDVGHKADAKREPVPRKAAGKTWEDPTLSDFPENDFRLFCGNLGNEVNVDVLSKAFSRFPSFNMARVIRDKSTGRKTKGYGFVSFSKYSDFSAAVKEMNGKHVGNQPIKLSNSNWNKRTDSEALERQKVIRDKRTGRKTKGYGFASMSGTSLSNCRTAIGTKEQIVRH